MDGLGSNSCVRERSVNPFIEILQLILVARIFLHLQTEIPSALSGQLRVGIRFVFTWPVNPDYRAINSYFADLLASPIPRKEKRFFFPLKIPGVIFCFGSQVKSYYHLILRVYTVYYLRRPQNAKKNKNTSEP